MYYKEFKDIKNNEELIDTSDIGYSSCWKIIFIKEKTDKYITFEYVQLYQNSIIIIHYNSYIIKNDFKDEEWLERRLQEQRRTKNFLYTEEGIKNEFKITRSKIRKISEDQKKYSFSLIFNSKEVKEMDYNETHISLKDALSRY